MPIVHGSLNHSRGPESNSSGSGVVRGSERNGEVPRNRDSETQEEIEEEE